MTNSYTADEVKSHNNSSDCWVIFKGKVYDVTPFLEDHPGGQEIVLEHAGLDCTNAFEDVGHSSSAYDMLKDFYIGDLVESKSQDIKKEADSCCITKCCDGKKALNSDSCKPSPCQTNWPVIGAALVIGAAIAYNAFMKK